MIKLTGSLIAAGLVASALAFTPVPGFADAHSDMPEMSAAEKAQFEAQRDIILSMAGDYQVVFDMREGTAWIEGYELVEPKLSGGYESVRVAEDTGTRIVLQHLLVVGDQENPYVVKHWRQDWEYEPAKLLTFGGGEVWDLIPVEDEEREGAWSQTVYQVDDSPRYAGIGEWKMHNGVMTWISNTTPRPLARRDAVRDPIYDHYVGVNRHQITPNGWIHWQDNTKMMTADDGSGKLTPVVQEYVLNTYARFDDYNVAAADDYWEKTADYWAAIRTKWEEIAEAQGGIRIGQQADYGTQIAMKLLMLADAVKNGEAASEAATAEAIAAIEAGTAQSGG